MTTYLSADDVRAIFAEADANEHLSAATGPDLLISARIGHTSLTCLGVAVECATDNRAENGADDDLFETYAEGANYLVDGISSCYCEA